MYEEQLAELKPAMDVLKYLRDIDKLVKGGALDKIGAFDGCEAKGALSRAQQILEKSEERYKEYQKGKKAWDRLEAIVACDSKGHVGEWIFTTMYEMGWKDGKWYSKSVPMRVVTCTRCGQTIQIREKQ